MASQDPCENVQSALESIIGYLNFSSGAFDAKFLRSLDIVFQTLEPDERGQVCGRRLQPILREAIEKLRGTSPAFENTDQAERILELVFDEVAPAYLSYHADLLFHQADSELFNAFFVGRVCEVTLQQGPPWEETQRIVSGAIRQLSDYVGHRPLATLENQKLTVPTQEKVRPVPLYVAGAGVATGRYAEVVGKALQILRETDREILETAQFDPEQLAELAYDPRAYDFDHPVNRRPNYHFGQWDPHHIDEKGNYRRFVIQQVTLDALHARIASETDIPRDQLVFEAAAVLAGTILMAAGIGGRGPGTISADIPLTSLLGVIAGYRDRFYDSLLVLLKGEHATRLQEEARMKRQSFGAARQHINAELARQRASQLEHVHLARVYARMGYLEDAQREADVVPVASARMNCQIDCSLMAGHHAIDQDDLEEAGRWIIESVDTMHRAIACGALIDPWNILGFDAQFALFHGLENCVHDHRADEIVLMLERIFELCSRLWNEAAAKKQTNLVQWVSEYFRELAEWWHRFATHEVDSVEAFDAMLAFDASKHVAECLTLWHEGGGSEGDVRFWAEHASRFDSPTAYALVIEALLEQGDFLASRGLLMHWIGQAAQIPLEQGQISYFELSYRWIVGQLRRITQAESQADDSAAESEKADSTPTEASSDVHDEVWPQVSKWFDYLEANAESLWRVPVFDLSNVTLLSGDEELVDEDQEEEEGEDIYDAAYVDVVYQDSTDDGIDGAIYEQADYGADELELESRRIGERLSFLSHLAQLWKVAGLVGAATAARGNTHQDRIEAVVQSLNQWIEQAKQNRHDLDGLLRQIEDHPLTRPGADHDSMLEYDRQRLLKENLLDLVISVCVETEDANQTLVAAQVAVQAAATGTLKPIDEQLGLTIEQTRYVETLAAAMVQDRQRVEEKFGEFCQELSQQPLLYVPLAKGGDPHKIVSSRIRRMAIQELLVALPRLGLIESTHHLLELAREMEQSHPVGQGAVTEFDELFKIGYCAMVEAIGEWSQQWPEERQVGEINVIEAEADDDDVWSREARLFLAIERLAERSLVTWLEHSKTLRLSVLEKVRDRDSWESLVEFVKTYGGDLFTQRFFNLGNLRAILHQGVTNWVEQLEQDPGDYRFHLLDSLDDKISKHDACRWLTLILEAIIENYAEYRDYNSTTTQSDRGELLYMLLDFLRLRVRYDRVAWHLRPVIWSHERLVRTNCEDVARRWRRAVRQRIGNEPERYLERLKRLQQKYAMQMPSIADRIQERFLMPMRVDRIRSFVQPAVEQRGTPAGTRAIESLRLETKMLTHEPTGAGLEVPRWLASLEDEVERVMGRTEWDLDLDHAIVPRVVEVAEPELFEQLVHLHNQLEGEFDESDSSDDDSQDDAS